MKCTTCGAETDGIACEYCGSALPVNEPDNLNIDNSKTVHTIINNYYEHPPVESSAVHTLYPHKRSQVYEKVPAESPKSKLLAMVLCVVFGVFGAHYFYTGRIGMGILYFFTMGLFCVGWIIDIYRIATGKFADSNGQLLLY